MSDYWQTQGALSGNLHYLDPLGNLVGPPGFEVAPQRGYEQFSSQPTGFEGTGYGQFSPQTGYGQFSPQVTAPTQQANAFEPTNINLLQNYYQGQQ